MPPETRNCQNCKNDFIIDASDFKFYEKIKVPPPNWCPECRMVRRLAFRNERTLYRRSCDLCKKEFIAAYPASAPFPVYCEKCWWSDDWNPLAYGRDYDFSRPFFDQYHDLERSVPHTGLINLNNVRSDYVNWLNDSRDCYLVFGSSRLENCLYSELLLDSKDTLDSSNSTFLEKCYQGINVKKSYGCVWGVNLINCINVLFSYDCSNCSNCLLSYNLRHKSYCILNVQYSKEEYEKHLKELLGSYRKMEEALEQFRSLMSQKAIHRFANLIKCVSSTGNDLIACGRARYCFDSTELEDCKFMGYGYETKDSFDNYAIGQSQLCYETTSTAAARIVASIATWYGCFDVQYSQFSLSSHDLFGCYGLRKKEYCILNKQYEKSEYQALVGKIVEAMKKRGEYGIFFPGAISSFGYNESMAQDFYPLAREEALRKNYPWQDATTGQYGKETISPEALPDHIAAVDDSILKEVLACISCGRNYRLAQQELGFYKTMSLPVPRKCPDCRYRERLQFRNPRRLWKRQCMCDYLIYKNSSIHNHHEKNRCPNEFETTYSPERMEIVYCEQCYLREVV